MAHNVQYDRLYMYHSTLKKKTCTTIYEGPETLRNSLKWGNVKKCGGNCNEQ